MENLYDILEVSKKASKEIIEKAYKTLAKKYHPDLQSPENKAKAEEMMKKINEAYDVLSDEQKRKDYDAKLEEENKQKSYYQPENKEYSQNHKENSNNYYKENNNVEYQSNYNYEQNYNYAHQNQTYNTEFENWREAYSKLTQKEQAKLRRKIQRQANNEYRQLYEDYFRSLGYKVKHKWTLKDFLILLLVLISLAIIFLILWWIPATHERMVGFYNENILVRIIVNIIIGIWNGIVQFVKNIFNK